MNWILLILILNLLFSFLIVKTALLKELLVKSPLDRKWSFKFERNFFILLVLLESTTKLYTEELYFLGSMSLIFVFVVLGDIFITNNTNKKISGKKIIKLKNTNNFNVFRRYIYACEMKKGEYILLHKTGMDLERRKFDRNIKYKLVKIDDESYSLNTYFMDRSIKKTVFKQIKY